WLLQADAAEADWVAAGDSLKAVSRRDSAPLLAGRVFCSTGYFFERQIMDRPDSQPMNRALSVTLIGRLPVSVEIAAVLYAPGAGGDADLLSGAACLRDERSTALVLPREGRAVVFASADSLDLDPQVAACDFVLVAGLAPGRTYALERSGVGTGQKLRLAPADEGTLRASEAGNLVLEKTY
ncbi:MAG: hypothetical protein JXQ83_14690, partial [Candidatus Glassbacteria bacterium]|nr:hypothetical protein [Candidatus Glassbacteria bacterium]